MGPLIAIAANLLPGIVQAIAGDRSGKAAEQVSDIVRETLKTDDPVKAQELLKDPKVEIALRQKLLDFSLEQQRLDLENTEGARTLQTDLAKLRSPVAWVAPVLSLIVTVGFFVVLGLFVYFKTELEAPPDVSNLTQEQVSLVLAGHSDFVIQIINICIGALTAAFATVMSFWLGSSSGSQAKDRVNAALQTAQSAREDKVVERAATNATDRFEPPEESGSSASGPGPSSGPGGGPADTPMKPAPLGLFAEEIPEMVKPHRQFPDSVKWALAPDGISVDGAVADRTTGNPDTVTRIWRDFGGLCAEAAKKHGVPVELIIATIATESDGKPNARRPEPQIGDESVGLMQTLVDTARGALDRPSLRGDDLLDPRTSIDAGTAYITQQRGSTHFDPPLVAAAYNAGKLKRDDGRDNRWKLHCHPRGTGKHIDNFVRWFGDCMRVSAAEGWAKDGVPSFASALGAKGGADHAAITDQASAAAPAGIAAPAVDRSGPDFPRRPDFDPLITTEDRQKLFGIFDFVPDPQPDNAEHIRITGNWAKENIVEVVLPVRGVLGKDGPFKMQFNKKAAEQLISLWLDWEMAGLIDRIISYDGAFVPRFQRKSTRLSNHAFGTAFDINAAFNGLGARPAMLGQRGCVRELVEIANKRGFFWGGHFNRRLDGMHFEVADLK